MLTPPVQPRRLSSLDAAFLYLETDEAPLHIGGVSVLDGDLTASAFASRLDARLPAVPRYLERLELASLAAGQPTWEPDPGFDVHRHVIETHLASPGSDAELQACAARLFAPRLDRDRPLWEFHVIRGLEGGRTALLSKIHHAMVDGISGVELMDVVFDLAADAPTALTARPSVTAEATDASPARGTAQEGGPVWNALGSAAATAADMLEEAAQLAATWPSLRDRAVETVRALVGAALHPVARLPFNRTLTGERRLGWISFSLEDVRAVGQARHGTVNDVALAILADGIGRWLASLGEPTRARFLRVLVPVNVRREDQRGQLGNRVSMIPIEVPFEADPLARLEYVVARTAAMKRARIADLVARVARAGDLLPPGVLSRVLPVATSRSVLAWTAPLRALPFLTANMVCTNVPGPPVPLYGVGHRLVAHYPIVPLGFETGMNCAVLTYDGVLYLALLADAAAVNDLGPLTAHLQSAYNDLHTSAGHAGVAAPGPVAGRERPGRKERNAAPSRSARHTSRAHPASTRAQRRAGQPRSTRKR